MLIFVDCEAKESFHGIIYVTHPSLLNPAIPEIENMAEELPEVFMRFNSWLNRICIDERLVLISDNPAYDWQWIADGFSSIGKNPFGHSARRIGDVWAGITGNISDTSSWKKFRKTKHTHNPVGDAMGNVEAWETMMEIMKDKK